MSIFSEYSGRKFDLLAFSDPENGGHHLFDVGDYVVRDSRTGGQVTTGIQKAAQRWLLEFLTPSGGMGFHMASRGTDFIKKAQAGRFRHSGDVADAFATAAMAAGLRLRAEESEDTPDDEKIIDATLRTITLIPGSLSLTIELTSAAGSNHSFIVPIPITPTNLTL